MTDECVFCRIAKREFTAHVIYEDERILAFLDHGPIRLGHTQIIPKSISVISTTLPLTS
jgi:histidine triad (HIT) family protein